jgi:hypothetical protein
VNGAGATTSDAATELAALQFQMIPENPQQGRILRAFERNRLLVHVKFNHGLTSMILKNGILIIIIDTAQSAVDPDQTI